MSFINLCRSCMKEVDAENCTKNVQQMFKFCTNIQVLADDNLPKNFCPPCTSQIKSSYKYIKLAHEVNETLHQLINENNEFKTEFLKTKHEDVYHHNHIVDYETNHSIDGDHEKIMVEVIEAEDLVLPCEATKIKKVNINETREIKNVAKTCDNNNEQVNESILVKTQEVRLEDTNSKINLKDSNTYEPSKNVCSICQRVFSSGTTGKIYLRKHIKLHSSPKNKFKDVDTNSAAINDLKVDENPKVKSCPKCQKSFTSQTWLRKHMDREHSRQRAYSCTFCSKVFETSHQYRYHKRMHLEDKEHVCNACGKIFKFKKHLSVHALTHSEERPYICDICHMSFKMKHVLINHMKVHENRQIFLCYVCGKHLASANSLDSHMLVHTKERPYACRWCEYRSNHKTAVRRHEYRHLSLRKHVCTHCQKRFYESGSLAKHMRIHSGERPYKCSHCPLGFPDGWKRKTHLMRVHHLTLEEIPRLTRDGVAISTETALCGRPRGSDVSSFV